MDADIRASYEAHLASSGDAVIVIEEWRGDRLGLVGIFRDLTKAAAFVDECEGNCVWMPRLVDDPHYGNRGKVN